MPEGPSFLGSKANGQAVIIEDGVAKLPDRSAFAGSVATTDRLVRVMVRRAGLSVTDAIRLMTANPARFMGIDRRKGTIAVGKDADLVLFDEQIAIQSVYVMGKRVTI